MTRSPLQFSKPARACRSVIKIDAGSRWIEMVDGVVGRYYHTFGDGRYTGHPPLYLLTSMRGVIFHQKSDVGHSV